MQLPDELDDDLLEILGRPNFACSPIAHAMRTAGQSIRPKAEDEQAHVLFKLLGLYAKHGAEWRKYGAQWIGELRDAAEAAKAATSTSP